MNRCDTACKIVAASAQGNASDRDDHPPLAVGSAPRVVPVNFDHTATAWRSPGLRDRLGVEVEQTDEELAAAEVGGVSRVRRCTLRPPMGRW